jgi:hypothetical protein
MRAIGKRFFSLFLGAALAAILASSAFGTTNPVPFVNQPLVPAAAVPGGPAFTLTVNGTGFVSGAVVNWNGSARTTTFVSSSQLTASILVSDIALAGTANVTVTNPGGYTSLPAFFSVNVSYPAVGLARSNLGVADSTGAAAGDFNGDGIQDLAVYGRGGITIEMGNGDGTFNALPPISPGAGVPPMVVADVNNDGKLDIIEAGAVLLGNGDGTFQPAMNFLIGNPVYTIGVADFNRDGKVDLAITAGNAGISILLGNGDGTFQAAGTYDPGAGDLVVGDFNSDGNLDLAVDDNSGISVLLGNGDGTFQTPYNVVPGSSGYTGAGLATADLNGDAILDLVSGGPGGFTMEAFGAVYLGNGDGTFGSPIPFMVGYQANEILLGDFNGDGKVDVVIPQGNSGAYISIFLGNGDGTLQAPANFTVYEGAFNAAVADFDGNGTLDLAVPTSGGATIPVLLTTTVVLPVSDFPISFQTEDIGMTSPPMDVTLTNVNSSSLTIDSIAFTGLDPQDFGIQSNTCGTSVAAGATCTVAVTFTPTAAGERTASLAFTDNAPASPQTVPLEGEGEIVTAPAVTLSPTSLSFPSEVVNTTSAPEVITLTNSGTGTLQITNFEFTGDSGDFAQTNTCGSKVGAGDSCTISVTFTPVTTGIRTAILNIFDNASGSPQMVTVTGTGINGLFGAPVLSPGSFTLTAGSSGTFTATVTPATGFSGQLNFSCTGAPAGAACSPGTPVTNSNGTITSTVTITTTAASVTTPAPGAPTSRQQPLNPAPLLILLSGFACSLGVFPLTKRLRPAWRLEQRAACAVLVLLLTGIGLLAGCSSGGGGGGGGTPTPPGTYKLTVSASASGQTQSSTFILTVQ